MLMMVRARTTEGSNNTRMTVFTTSPPAQGAEVNQAGRFQDILPAACVMCCQQMLLMNFR